MDRHRTRFYIYAGVLALVMLTVAVSLRRLLADLPPMSALEEYTPSLTTRVYDRNGELLGELFTERRELLSLSEIPVDLQNAVIATEDDAFFEHWGVSPVSILRAAWSNFWARRVVQGGSTVTQQLSRLIFLNREKSVGRKIKEALLALQIERNFSKQEILQLYLNQYYFGHGAYGVQSAALFYYGKKVGELNLPECAMLAGLLQAPNRISPFRFPERARRRRSLVLQRMEAEGYVTAEERREAEKEPVPAERPPLLDMQGPYFVEAVRQELEPRYGFNALWKGGLEIHTTLDLEWQKAAERIMEQKLAEYDKKVAEQGGREEPYREEDRLQSAEVEVSTEPVPIQGAFVLLEPKTGAVRALVGGRDYAKSQFNRAVQAQRQPGSALKPFVWAAALEAGLTAATTVADEPLAYYNDGRDWRLFEGTTDQFMIYFATAPFAVHEDFRIWVPSNFGGRFAGEVTLRNGLERSRNLVSIRLVDRIGASRVTRLARRMGIQSRLSAVLSLGLGTSAVSPLELASAMGTFGNGGIHVEPHMVTRVLDASGRVLEEHTPKERAAISPQIAYAMTHMLQGVVQNGTGKAATRLRRPVGGKTGTTQGNRDLWFVGFTPDLAAASWMGYDDDVSLGERGWTGGGSAAPWWTDIMQEVLKGTPAKDFPVPDNVTFAKIDTANGFLALPSCPQTHLEAFLAGTEPRRFCPVDHAAQKELERRRLEEEAAQGDEPAPEVPSGI